MSSVTRGSLGGQVPFGMTRPKPDIPTWTQAFLQVFTALTLVRVLLWGLLLALTGAAYLVYSHQDELMARWVLSAKPIPLIIPAPEGRLRDDMVEFVDLNPYVAGLQVVDVDLAANTRTTVWYYSDSADLTRAFDQYQKSKTGPAPWITGSRDLIAMSLASAVNSASVCLALKDTPLARRVPGMDRYVSDLCTTPVPPPYGPFSGYISAWLTRPFDIDEQQELVNRLRIFSARLQPMR